MDNTRCRSVIKDAKDLNCMISPHNSKIGNVTMCNIKIFQDTNDLSKHFSTNTAPMTDRSIKDIKVFPPHANFVLVKLLRDDITSNDLFDATIRKGLMIRDCSTFPFLDNHYIRFCFMEPEKNDLLLDTLIEQLNK